MSAYFDLHTDAIGTLEKIKREYEQLQKWHRESITYAEKVKAAENALEAERAAHQETRTKLNVLTNERGEHNTELANGWARLEQERTRLRDTTKPTRIMRDLAENNERAKKNHGTHANIMVTLGVLSQEIHELQDAVHSREERLIRAELLDVATSALRGVEALDERAEAERKRMEPYARCKCSHMKANHYGESAGCMDCDCSLYRQDA